MLIYLGKRSGLKKLSKEEVETLNIISNACERLSIKNIGALIVIQRKEDIVSHLTDYITLDAQLTEDIFFFIFDKKSLIHDGAVVVKNDRILYVSAVIPLTEKDLPEKHMGTRHRAAVGITEQTDAITIVVSEETGRMSVCENGKMHLNLSKTELKRTLKKLLYFEEEKQEGLIQNEE